MDGCGCDIRYRVKGREMTGSHTYTDECRRESADHMIASGRPAMQMADEIGVNRKMYRY